MIANYRWVIAGAVLAAALLAVWVMLAAALLNLRAGLPARGPERPAPLAPAQLIPQSPGPTIHAQLMPWIQRAGILAAKPPTH
jgi:hypothetical protein